MDFKRIGFEERGKPEHPEKNLSEPRERTNNKQRIGFEEMGKPEHPEKNLSKQRRKPTTNSTHINVVDAWI